MYGTDISVLEKGEVVLAVGSTFAQTFESTASQPQQVRIKSRHHVQIRHITTNVRYLPRTLIKHMLHRQPTSRAPLSHPAHQNTKHKNNYTIATQSIKADLPIKQ